MTEILLCISLCGFSYLISNELWKKKLRDAESAKMLAEEVGRMITTLEFERPDVYRICRETLGRKFPGFIFDTKEKFPGMWQKACIESFSEPETRRLALLVGETLGGSDSMSQAAALRIIQSDIRSLSERMYQKSEGDGKIYKAVGAFLGLALSVMVI